jgi:DNA-binding protein H-NS
MNSKGTVKRGGVVMAINLEKLSMDDLERLRQDVTDQIQKKREARREEFFSKVKEMAKEEGITASDIVGHFAGSARAAARRRMSAARAAIKPKFKDPESGRTWSGRGRRPKWVEAHLEGGGSLDDLKI